MKPPHALIFGLSAMATPALACVCIGFETDLWAWQHLREAKHVVHGKIVEVMSANVARIKVIHSFKGKAVELEVNVLTPREDDCSANIRLYDEYIFLVAKDLRVEGCDMLAPNEWSYGTIQRILAMPTAPAATRPPRLPK
jgi:hypothetical protein